MYQKYHTSLIFAYKIDLLDANYLQSIPASTKAYWKNNCDFEKYLGKELADNFEEKQAYIKAILKCKQYFVLCKCLWFLFQCYSSIVHQSSRKNKLIKSNKSLFINTFDYLNRYFSASVCCRYLGVSAQQIARWRKSLSFGEGCRVGFSKICLRASPTQLTVIEQAAIKSVLLNEKYIHLPFSYKWSVLLRNHSVVVGKSVFYKYAHLILGSFSKSEFHVSLPAVRASSCFEILHMDSTLVKTVSGLRVYVHFVMDNFSKAILGAVCCENARSAVVAQNVKSVIEKYGLKSARVYSDDGPENHGEVETVLKGSTFEQVFANFKLGKSNNMIEALNKKFKRFVLLNFSFETPADLEALLPEMVDYYNNMLQPVLGHRSPLEVLNGIEELKFDLVEARRKRIEVNKERCCLGDF